MSQSEQILRIKNMVCPRCVTVVEDTLRDLGFKVIDVELGWAKVQAEHAIPKEKTEAELQHHGFALIKGKHQQLVEQIKMLLLAYIEKLEESDDQPKLSDYLSDELHKNYSSLSSVFSESEGTTIEKYLIHLKIERVKELLSYEQMTLSEIAYQLNYSSVAYLSKQFKEVTGMSVTDYKKARDSFRKPLDGLKD
ncbi:AraC-type DNA-binding protein [Fodinibius salinus]|uniref:AraC-type DNA-binding protein n=1 Tax=Fodinibius salinus TaxID=860790 RepID=A0A5D3YFH1_9BACT|nr:AraC family transcriptional regulator [Fodinibius salinus]TYP92166.1 AraC-type DNA-binding protein [Fodinibius salinus]